MSLLEYLLLAVGSIVWPLPLRVVLIALRTPGRARAGLHIDSSDLVEHHHLVAPQSTIANVQRFNDWLDRTAGRVAADVLGFGGVCLLVRGLVAP